MLHSLILTIDLGTCRYQNLNEYLNNSRHSWYHKTGVNSSERRCSFSCLKFRAIVLSQVKTASFSCHWREYTAIKYLLDDIFLFCFSFCYLFFFSYIIYITHVNIYDNIHQFSASILEQIIIEVTFNNELKPFRNSGQSI